MQDVFPGTAEQRCWFHKIANVLNDRLKSAHPGAKKALAEIWNAEDKDHAEQAARAFADEYGSKWPKAAAKITDDLDVLLGSTTPRRALGPPAHDQPDRVDLRDRAAATAPQNFCTRAIEAPAPKPTCAVRGRLCCQSGLSTPALPSGVQRRPDSRDRTLGLEGTDDRVDAAPRVTRGAARSSQRHSAPWLKDLKFDVFPPTC